MEALLVKYLRMDVHKYESDRHGVKVDSQNKSVEYKSRSLFA